MNVSKTIYSEKLRKKLVINLNENKCDGLSSSASISAVVYTDREPEGISNSQVRVLVSSYKEIFEKTYIVKDDENKFINVLERVIENCEHKVSIDIAAVEKFNEKSSTDKICEMLVDFKNRIEKLETGKADKISGEEALKIITEGLRRMGVSNITM